MSSRRVLGLGARLSKLKTMSAAELLHRVQYRVVIGVERWQHRTKRLVHPDRLRRGLEPAIAGADWRQQLLASRRARRAQFFPSVSREVEMRRLFQREYARERRATMAQAEDARRHRFAFFGQSFEYGDHIPWQSDPISGRAWPAAYHADVPVHGGDVGFGDVKHVWELSRQQFLIDLGKAWFLEGNRDDLEAVRRLVRSWIAGNPFATGVNWSCALEPAFQTFSWLWAYYLTVSHLDDEFHLEWLIGFHDYGHFIARHLEHYSSPYNHLMAEAAALYMLGASFPEFRASPRWRRLGRQVIESRLAEQFYADGGSVEQSTFYHHATVGFLILAALTARAAGDDLSPRVWEAIEKGIDFSTKLTQPDGTIPAIGGADDGKPIRMEHIPLWDFRSYQAIGAVLFKRPDFKAVAGRFHEDALWLLGPTGLASFEALDSRPPHGTSTELAASGYYVLRSDWSDRADFICFDCGEQAAGMRTDATPNAMHGHADCLSVVAWLEGRRVLVDSGLYGYNCGGEWEAHFRETAAHNTARVDGRDQATHIGKMAWSHSYRASIEGWSAGAGQSWAVGSHDGYARGPTGVTHRRAVWLRPDSYVVIYDEFIGTGRHDFEVNYQFAAGELELVSDDCAVFDNHVDIAWAGSGSWTLQIKHGGPHPQDGWIAPSLGVRQAAPRLTLICTSQEPQTSLLTVLASRVSKERRVSVTRVEDHASLLTRVSGNGYTDWVAASSLAPSGPITTDALVAVGRVLENGAIETSRIGGTHVHVDAKRLGHLSSTASVVRTRP